MSQSMERARILIVDDEEGYQELYTEILADSFDLRFAGDKDEAVYYLQDEIFDVALIDLRLKPGDKFNREGLDVAQTIRDLDLHMVLILKSGFPTETPEITARVRTLKFFAVADKTTGGQVKQLRRLIDGAVMEKVRLFGHIH